MFFLVTLANFLLCTRLASITRRAKRGFRLFAFNDLRILRVSGLRVDLDLLQDFLLERNDFEIIW